jgi:hypothetical protein
MLKNLWKFTLVLILLILVPTTYGQEQFLTNYDVNYDIGTDGVTSVSENITFRNTTDKFYASKYTVSIGATKISDIQASDKSGPLVTNITTEGNRTKIEVGFDDQIVGLDKEYTWTLRYKSRDYAEKSGKIWQVTIPRAPKLLSGDGYNLNLSVPVSFGDPTTIDPSPSRKVESGGKIRMYYDKNQLDQRGILASFGSTQLMSFDIKYTMRNSGVLPVYGKVPLPMDTNFQQVLIDSLVPKPENVVIDDDGNYIAWYKMERESSLDIQAKGMVKLSLKSSSPPQKELSKFEVNRLIKPDKFWDVDNPLIKQKLAEILKSSENASVREKARLINKFVVTYLSYDHDRVDAEDFGRLGALAAINNPDNALCGEYADLFVTLARSAGIPARRLEGYAYTSNQAIRPLSLGKTLLHAWAEYYDPVKGWVMVDPTWESANDGVDYFSNFDLNHFVLAIVGGDSDDPQASGDVKVEVSEANFVPISNSSLEITAPDVVLSGLPANVTVRVNNIGSAALRGGLLELSANNVGRLEEGRFETGVLPPFGYFEEQTRLSPLGFLSRSEGDLVASFSGVLVQKEIKLKPFYEYQTLFGLAVGSLVLMIGVYVLSLYLHIRSQKSEKGKLKKTDATKIYRQSENT